MGARVSALLLAAGAGTRLRPFTDILPKCLMPVCGEPLLGIWLRALTAAGIDDIIVNTHHHAELVRDYIGSSDYARTVRLTHEEHLLDTAGTLLANEKHFRHDTVMLVHADNLSSFDVGDFVSSHERRPLQADITMMTFDTDSPSTCGIIECDGQGIVTAFHEKVANPPGIRANAAVYLMSRGFVRDLAQKTPPVRSFSNDVLPHLMGKIFTWHNGCYHRDIGNPESLQKAQGEWRNLGTDAQKGRPADPWFGLFGRHPGLKEKLVNSYRNRLNFDLLII